MNQHCHVSPTAKVISQKLYPKDLSITRTALKPRHYLKIAIERPLIKSTQVFYRRVATSPECLADIPNLIKSFIVANRVDIPQAGRWMYIRFMINEKNPRRTKRSPDPDFKVPVLSRIDGVALDVRTKCLRIGRTSR